jgi:hypothetical protein
MPAKKKTLKSVKQSIEQYIESTTANILNMDLNQLFIALDKVKNEQSRDDNKNGFNNIISTFEKFVNDNDNLNKIQKGSFYIGRRRGLVGARP